MGWLWHLALWGFCAVVFVAFIGKFLQHVSDSYPAPDDERDDL